MLAKTERNPRATYTIKLHFPYDIVDTAVFNLNFIDGKWNPLNVPHSIRIGLNLTRF